jgi:serine/threonine protein kinase/Flp pilus assembly protein TadD
MPADMQRARELFMYAVGKVPPERWDEYVCQACEGETELAQLVQHFLQVHREVGSFLESPVACLTPPCVRSDEAISTIDEPISERPGTLIGPYKLLEQIGQGGFGVVFMAEQQQPVRRKVALKVIKPGMDTRQVIARFEAERQALALMDHPNIAKVFDGGTTGTPPFQPYPLKEDGEESPLPPGGGWLGWGNGRPFFVMELVNGPTITDYCDQNNLSVRERLELFLHVCQAVQHAHQKGIIHRDIKPSNVLVTVHDGTPTPKIIDFGIAKALGQQLTDKTLFTNFAQLIGTPLYMSPEQAQLSGLDIDTRSDIYSLGVLLYELLTGRTPFDKERLKEFGYDEMRRIIREEEPPKPSGRISTLGQAAITISTRRQSDPKRLSQLLRRELDWIVMKALEKDRNGRYETASSFAADVQCYLHDEPVQACPPLASYRFRKFALRHRVGLAVAGLVLFFITSLVGLLSWVVLDRAARRAKAANDVELALYHAELLQGEGKRAEALAALDRMEMLASEIPPDPAREARRTALSERLEAQARDGRFIARFEEIRLRVQSGVHMLESRFTKEAAFSEVRDALHQYDIAIGVMEPAQAAVCVQGRPDPVRGVLLAALDECLKQAPKEDSQSRQWLLAALADADNDAWRAQARRAWVDGNWKALEQLALEANVQKQPPNFLLIVANSLPAQMQLTRLELLRRTQRAYPADLWANDGLAFALLQNGQPAEAIRYYTAALALRPDNPGLYLNRGIALEYAGEVDEGIVDYRQSIALAPQYAAAHCTLGLALKHKGRLDEAIAEYREAIRLKKDFIQAHTSLGAALLLKGRLDEAITEDREAIRLQKENAGAHTNLGAALAAKGRIDEAIAEYREAIRLQKDNPSAHTNLGNVLKAKGDLDEAIAEYRQAIESKQNFSEAYKAHSGLGNALEAKGRIDEAIAEYREAIRLKKDLPDAHNNLGNALASRGRMDEAITEYHEAIRLKKDLPEAHYNLGLALHAKRQLGEAIAEYREAIRIQKNYAEAHCNLGHALRQQGEFCQALEELRRGHELGSKKPRWPYPSAQWVGQCERLVELDQKLPGFLEGKTRPASPTERVELAGLCALKRLNRAAVSFYQEAFAMESRLADDMDAGNRYSAACAAVLAACGQGEDAARVDELERAHWRKQALNWLGADLANYSKHLHLAKREVLGLVQQRLQHWQKDEDLTSVRDPKAIAKLPAEEQEAYTKLWADVDSLLSKARSLDKQEPTAGPQGR